MTAYFCVTGMRINDVRENPGMLKECVGRLEFTVNWRRTTDNEQTYGQPIHLFVTLHRKIMPNKADPAIKFIIQQLTDKKLDPRLDSESVIDLYKNDTTIRE
jgi:hypothetical protein